jgi:23S rRNA pseudouridine2605 synthase
MRLNQFLAKHTGISRRTADEVIKNGDVKVNGRPGVLGDKIENTDKVEVQRKGKWETFNLAEEESQVLLLYKPIFTVSTRDDPDKRRTIYDLIPRNFENHKSAGRLDYMSEGLLVLSTNGHLILSLTHPKFKTPKEYFVGLKKPLTHEQIDKAKMGQIELEDYLLNPVDIKPLSNNLASKYFYLKLENNLVWYSFSLSEGRNQQIRKMCKMFGNQVIRLIRVKHGRFELTEDIKKKGWMLVNSTGNEKTTKKPGEPGLQD